MKQCGYVACFLLLSTLLLQTPVVMAGTETVSFEALDEDGTAYSSGVITSSYANLWDAAESLYLSTSSSLGQSAYAGVYVSYALSGDSAPLQWTPSTAGTHYTLLATNDGDTSYVYTGTANYIDLWDLTDIGDMSPYALRVFLRAKTTLLPTLIQAVISVGGTVYTSTSFSLTTAYALYDYIWLKNPATNDYWTREEVNAAKVGVKYISGKPLSVARVTEAYARVQPWILAIYRYAVFFDTSSLTGKNVTEAYLNLKVAVDTSTKDFNVTIQNGQDESPERPSYPTLAKSDYYQGYYEGNGGSKNTSNMVVGSYFNISLTELTWINQTGITKFMLRNSRDIAAVCPREYQTVSLYYGESTNPPLLVVTYETEALPAVMFTGLAFLACGVGSIIFLARRKRS